MRKDITIEKIMLGGERMYKFKNIMKLFLKVLSMLMNLAKSIG